MTTMSILINKIIKVKQETGMLWSRSPLTRDEAVNQRGGHTENTHQQVTDGQVEDEEVRYRPHVAIPDDHQADEPIAEHAQEKHHQVGENVAHSHAHGVDVIWQKSAIVIQTEVGGWEVYGHCVHFGTWKKRRQLSVGRYINWWNIKMMCIQICQSK